jgi:uncharacterized membrane protein YedE/YeeE
VKEGTKETSELGSALVAGVIFGVGLALAGMTQPKKVVDFLDFAGDWDPSLMFVMGGAILLFGPAYQLIKRKRSAPILGPTFHLPTKTALEPKLFIGSALFGIGWGIAGYCPGPGLTSLVSLSIEPTVFVATMLMGMAVARLFEGRPTDAGAAVASPSSTHAESEG